VTGPGLNSESHYSLIVPNAEVNVSSVTNAGLATGLYAIAPSTSGNIGNLAVTGASYYSYQLSPNVFVGLSLTSPFGLSTEPENEAYKGAPLARTTKLLTVNASPTIAWRIAPGVIVGAGAQFQWGDATFKFATGFPQAQSSTFDGDGWAYGATAGILLQPAPGTSIGLGWRSQLTQEIEGDFSTNISSTATNTPVNAKVDVELPDIVALSLRQVLTPNTRLLGTIEWSNWSRFDELRLIATGSGVTALGPKSPGSVIAVIPANWSDGWFFSLGGEYDFSKTLTLRTGVAWEVSPVDSPEKRNIAIPDNDRLWLSIGATYRWSQATSFDFGYTHIFMDDAPFARTTITGVGIAGEVTNLSTDVVSVSYRTRW
jgi:long-chain fatty acid transport protein